MQGLISATGKGIKTDRLTLATIFMMGVFSVAIADESTVTGNMPIPDTQEAPVQEMKVNETTSQETPAINTQDKPKRGKVARAIFTSQIIDREPADNLTELSNDSSQIYFFTDLRDLEGQIVTHRWEYNGETMADVKFRVGGGPRWRVYSSKNLLPEWTGEWSVIVTNESGLALKAGIFEYTQAATADKVITAPMEPEPPTPNKTQ